MKKLNVRVLLLVFVVALSSLGLYGCQYKSGATATKTENVAQSKSVVYAGEDGKSVNDLLKAKYTVEESDSSFGVMVKSINGLASTDKEFWLYSVNGKPAEVAADKYITKSGDEIKWEYKGV